jgi:O-antigen/teichoic acid export membrane protein
MRRREPTRRPQPEHAVQRGRAVRNGTLNVVAQGVYAVFHIVAIIALARALGRAGLGEYYTAFALIVMVQVLSEAGLGTLLTHRIAQRPGEWKRLVAEATPLYLGAMAASILVLLLVGYAWAELDGRPAMLTMFAAAAGVCAAIHAQRLFAGAFQGLERFGYENAARIAQGAALAGGLLMTISVTRPGPGAAMLVLMASHVVAACILGFGLFRAWRRTPAPEAPRRRASAREWLRGSVPIGYGDAVRSMSWQADTLLLGLMMPASAVGVFSVAYRPLGPLNWLPRAIASALFPAFSRRSSTPDHLSEMLATSTRILTLIGIFIATMLFVLAEPVILLMAGPEFLDAVTPFRVLVWVIVLSFASYQLRYLFTALGRQRAFARLVTATFVLKVALELALLPLVGTAGAILGTLVCEFAFIAGGLVLIARGGVLRMDWARLGGGALSAGCTGLALWPLRSVDFAWLPLILAAAGVVYMALCVAFMAIGARELRALLGVLTIGGASVRDARSVDHQTRRTGVREDALAAAGSGAAAPR